MVLKAIVDEHPTIEGTHDGGMLGFLHPSSYKWVRGLPVFWRAQLWLLPLLMLAINGGVQAQMPGAFAETGLICGFVFMTIVALANMWTSQKLCWQAYYTGQVDYETLAYAVGGRGWKFITEFFIFALLFGTLVSGWITQGQTMATGIEFINPNAPNTVGWLVNGSGRILMLLSFIVILPAVFMTKLRTMEAASDISFIFIMVTVVWLIVFCIKHSFQYLGDSEQFPISGFINMDDIAGSVAVFGFVFYIQPIMMPLLAEMPPGKLGVRALSFGTLTTIGGTAYVIYAVCGFFGASALGQASVDTGNYLANDIGGGIAQGVLNIVYSVALLPSIPPFEYATRHALDSFITTFMPYDMIRKTHKWRQVILAIFIYSLSLALAEIFAGNVFQAIQTASAIGVLMVCYVIPVVNHFLFLFGWAGVQRNYSFMDGAPKSISEILADGALIDADMMDGINDSAAPKGAIASHTAPIHSDIKEVPKDEKEVPLTNGTNGSDNSIRSGVSASGPSATSEAPILQTKGAIRDGCLDYEYRPKNLLHPWVLFYDFFCPIFIVAFGMWASIETLKLVYG